MNACNVEWNVFVQRIGSSSIIAACIDVAQTIATCESIQLAGPFTDAKVSLGCIALCPLPSKVVIDFVVPLAKVVCLCASISRHLDP
jgi:hypothetical protein